MSFCKKMLAYSDISEYSSGMGKINILKSDFTGQVGEVYGVRQHGKSFMKAVPFSHAPHNTSQTRAVRAFTALNRLSSVIAKQFFQYMNLSAKGVYKNNAVSKFLKPAIQGGTFAPESINEVIPQDGSLQLVAVDYDLPAKTFSVQLRNTVESVNVKDEKIFIAFVTSNGTVKWSTVTYGENITVSGSFDFIDFSTWYIMAFKSVPRGNRRKLKGFTLYTNSEIVVVNGVWYLTRQNWETAPYVIDGTLYLNSLNASVLDSVLKITES